MSWLYANEDMALAVIACFIVAFALLSVAFRFTRGSKGWSPTGNQRTILTILAIVVFAFIFALWMFNWFCTTGPYDRCH